MSEGAGVEGHRGGLAKRTYLARIRTVRLG